MKQYTTPEQTAKLIELGFEPKQVPALRLGDDENYSIGELIEMLPMIVDYFTLWIGRDERSNQWFVKYHPRTLVVDEELVDALYDMCVKLKEKGVI